VKYLPAACAVLLGIVFAFGAMRAPAKLECDRSTCTYNASTFQVADVREVRFAEGFGKNNTQAESQIVFASGHQLSVGRADTDDARSIFDSLRSFFSPDGPPSLAIKGSGTTWMWLLVVGCAIAAGVLGVQAKRKPDTYQAPGKIRINWKKVKKYGLAALGFIAVVGAGQLVLMLVASQTQGTLVLECKQRCKFQGLECMPGASSRQSLDEGVYQIEVWASSGSALWIPKSFTITTGETTTFVCQ
jgi:hypothetical protein